MQTRRSTELTSFQSFFFFAACILCVLFVIAGVAFIVAIDRKHGSSSSSLNSMARWEEVATGQFNVNDTFNVMSPPVNCNDCIRGMRRLSATIYTGVHLHPNNSAADMTMVILSTASSPNSPIISPQVRALEGGDCCVILMNDLRLRTDTNVFINPSNMQGVSPSLTLASFLSANSQVRSILGESKTFVKNFVLLNEPMTTSNNGRNEVFFAALTNQPESLNIIAISIVYFTCTEFNQVSRQCVGELSINTQKIIFNVRDFVFGDAKQLTQVMDLPSVAVHEYGHGQGLGDFTDDPCGDASMFAAITSGETKKRTLHSSDKQCLQFLYGEVVQVTATAMTRMPFNPWKVYFLILVYFLSL